MTLEESLVQVKRSRDALKDVAGALQQELTLLRGAAAPPAGAEHPRLRWTIPVTQPLLMCSQIQRSGGTLLIRLLDGHPECLVHPSELRWGKPHGWPQLVPLAGRSVQEIFEHLEEAWPRKFAATGYHKYSNWTHQHHPEQTQSYPFIFSPELQRLIFARVLAGARLDSQRSALDAYLTSFFNAWLDYQNLYGGPKRWVAAFEPRLIARSGGIEALFTDYPDGMLITIVREPGGWLSSYGRHVGDDDAKGALHRWLDATAASLRAYEERPERVVVVLFEDLVHRTESVMRMLCARTGMAFAPQLLTPTYNSMPVLSDSSYELVTGIDPQVTTRYQATLSAPQLGLVERKARPRYLEVAERFRVGAAS